MTKPPRGRARLGQRRSVYIHDDQWADLVADAKAQDRTIAGTIRRAIAMYLNQAKDDQ
jgi:hypothetical protein